MLLVRHVQSKSKLERERGVDLTALLLLLSLAGLLLVTNAFRWLFRKRGYVVGGERQLPAVSVTCFREGVSSGVGGECYLIQLAVVSPESSVLLLLSAMLKTKLEGR